MTNAMLTVEWYDVDQKTHTTEVGIDADRFRAQTPVVQLFTIACNIRRTAGRRFGKVRRVLSVRYPDGTIDKVTA